MKFKILYHCLIILTLLLLKCCYYKELPKGYIESPVPSVKQSQFNFPIWGLRDKQYCEVIPVFKIDDKTITEVYNTISCNVCPEEKWSKLTNKKLKIELGLEDIKLNGPRHWVIDWAKQNSSFKYDKTSSFGDIQMSLVAQIDSKIEINEYTEIEVKRWNTWFYLKNKEVYKLTNHKGEEYIMQSYSRQVNTNQTIKELNKLGGKLKTPEGWSFKSEILKQDLEITSNGKAVVIQDEFGNTYQKITL